MDAAAVNDRKRDGSQGNDEDEDFRGEFQILKHKTLVGLPYYGTLKQKMRPISWSWSTVLNARQILPGGRSP